VTDVRYRRYLRDYLARVLVGAACCGGDSAGIYRYEVTTTMTWDQIREGREVDIDDQPAPAATA
jgi:hypothetical protein